MQRSRPALFFFYLLLLAPCLLVHQGCGVVAETGRSQLLFYSDREMASLAVQAYAEETSKYKVVTGTTEATMLRRVGQRIALASGRPYDWEFKLLDAPKTVNAFALPGGKIAVYTGILKVTQNEDGLAAVIGHEVAHATSGHGNERMSQGTVAAIVLEGANFGLQEWKGLSEENRAGIMTALGIGTKLGILKYSRTHESEADEIGLLFLIRAGYNPEEAPRLWERMAALSPGGTPTWLSTHPDPSERARRLRELIPKMKERVANEGRRRR